MRYLNGQMRGFTVHHQIMFLAFSLVCTGLSPGLAYGQNVDRPRSVVVVPAANRTGETSLDAVGTTVSQTIESSLLMLDDFDVRATEHEVIPPAVVAGEPVALEQFAQSKTAGYVVFGSVSTDFEDQIVIEMAVWDQRADSVALQMRQTASSLFNTFTVADELAIWFLSAFSGERIAFGSIQLEPGGWEDGSYTVFVDGMEMGVDTPVISRVLIGDRTLEVTANNGPEAGAVLVRELVTVREAEATTLAFTVPGPQTVPPSGAAPIEPEVTATDARPRALALRLQSGGGFLGAGGLDFYPGRGIVRTGLVAGAALSAEEPTPAIAAAVAIEPRFGRLVTPVGVSSFITADQNAVTAAVGASLGLSLRFDWIIREIFFDNVIYFNAYPDAGLPLVYLPVIGVRL